MAVTRYGTRVTNMTRSGASAARAAAGAGFVMADGRLKMTTTLNMDNNSIINLVDGSNDQDAAAFNQANGGGGVAGDAPVDIQSVYFDDLDNVSGAQLDKGTIVTFSDDGDDIGIVKNPANTKTVIGVMAEDAADGAAAKVIYAGRAQVLIKNSGDPRDYVYQDTGTAGMGFAQAAIYTKAFAILEDEVDGTAETPVLGWCRINIAQEVY